MKYLSGFFKFNLWTKPLCTCTSAMTPLSGLGWFFSRSRSLCRRPSFCLSVCRLSVCRLSSVTFVHPTQAIEIFGNVSTPFGTLVICDPSVKMLRRSSQGNPSVGRLNQRGVEKCSDFGPFQGYISETVQDRR